MKVLSTRPKPIKFIDDYIDIPNKLISRNQLLDLYIDAMFINTELMLTIIDISIKYRCLVPLDNRISEELLYVLDNVLSNYNRSGFFIKLIHCDGEFK